MNDQGFSRLQSQIETLLRGGVIISGVALGAGLLLEFARLPGAAWMLDAGLIALLAIPCARIAASFADAVRRGDRLLAFATAMVLCVMAVSLVYSLSATR